MAAGRKRSETSRLAALAATRALLVELGYERITLDAIAARAGVGRQTLYRWWGSKGAIVADAALAGGVATELRPIADSGDLRGDLRAWLNEWVSHVATPEGTSLTLALTAASSDNQAIADQLYERFTGPHEEQLRARLARAREVDQLPADADVSTIAAVLIGFLLYRILGRQRLPAASDVDALVSLVVRRQGDGHGEAARH
ncbi:TetR family transcriptional regulator [Microterricola gilva]|uniref:TetR family transcriptional regulator n=1 Tax=Microterricola gilva TaxID=393267 RepID=A0A4Q8ALA6_9MICO|nr:TetR/AcrR family transcriptional regulator [Microterricola gilva]RZU65327.1 TetR family transcriptional regulator [Microterricola gilva]